MSSIDAQAAKSYRYFGSGARGAWGRRGEPPAHGLVRWLFLRALGVIYFIAFVSLWGQIHGLVGSHGILPADSFIAAATTQFDAQGIGADRYRVLPTLSWFSASDTSLVAECVAGSTIAVLLVLGITPGLCLLLLWFLYLSLVSIGQDFLGFQWDSLLLETGFLAIFLAPWSWRSNLSTERPPSLKVLWLLRWLLFRLMFESGSVKLLSGDLSWRRLTALTVHYETQPLPTWIGWYAHQLPAWAQRASCVGVFAIEIGVPFLIFAPRRLRLAGCATLVAFQVLILLTGNYTFFNWLTIALCLLLLDDAAVRGLTPVAIRARLTAQAASPPAVRHAWLRVPAGACAAVFVLMSLVPLSEMFGAGSSWIAPAAIAANWVSPLRSVNSYGLFAVMTTSRQEIEVQGSDDDVTWQPYAFKHKPGDVTRRPDFVAPFQPRLDWQMWFEALGTWRDNTWFVNFCERLLEGSPPVLALLATNPFPGHPPRYIRAMVYDYQFTDLAERRATGAWWRRTLTGEYLPVMTLAPDSR